MDDNKSLMIVNYINELFKIESSIAVTNNSECFKAIEVKTGRSVILSILKRRFNTFQESDDISNFLERLEKIKNFNTSLSNLLSFGVDKDGTGYSVYKIFSVNSVLSGKMSYGEASRRFEAMLQILINLHSKDIVLGDVCNNTFSISRDGNISVLNLNGSFPSKYNLSLVEEDYLLPSNNEPISKASDIYKFGILCYRLFLNDANAYPFDETKTYIPITYIKPEIPQFIDNMIKTCIAKEPLMRFRDAIELMNFVKRERELSLQSVDNGDAVTPTNEEFSKVRVLNEIALREENDDKKRETVKKVSIGVGSVLLILLLIFIKLNSNTNTNIIIPNKNIKLSKDLLIDREEKLKKIYDSEDPVLYVAIVNMAVRASTPTERKLVERYILKRFNNFQYDKLVSILKDFFDSIVSNDTPNYYEKLLLSLDRNFPIEKRVTIFKELSKINKVLIVDLAMALSLDENDNESYRSVFTEFLDEEYKKTSKRRSFDALVIAEYTSWLKYGELLKEKLANLNDEDLVWELPIFVKRDDKYLQDIIDIVTKRDLLDKVQTKFLSLVNEIHPPKDIKAILFRAGTQNITRQDIQIIANWININKIKVLCTMILALKDDSLLKKEIFDVLSVITLEDDGLNKFIHYVKEHEWNNRGELVTFIPYLESPKDFSEDDILDVLKMGLKKIESSNKRKILTLIVENSDETIKKIVFENFYNELGIGVLINYLSYDDKAIKKLAIKGLKEADIDDVMVSNLIIEKYENEKDDEIRALYKSNFWFIRQREN